jgi:hypothetical protein
MSESFGRESAASFASTGASKFFIFGNAAIDV